MGKTHGKHARIPERRVRKRRVAKRALVIACACVALLFAGAVAAYGIAQSTGRGNLVQSFLPSVGSMATVGDNGRTVFHEGSKYHQRKDMTSILLMGHDGRQDEALNGQVDFIMVAAIDTSSGKITLIYIPRDTMVDVQRTYDKSDEYADTVRMQIAAAFAYGSDFEHSAERMCETVSQLLFNIPLNYYYLMDVNGVGALADAVDGVQLESLEDVPKTDMKKGESLDLRGEQARLYVTERDTHEEWSAGKRLERQKQFVDEYAKKLLEVVKEDPGAALRVFDSVVDYSVTNLGPGEIAFLASMFAKHGMNDMDVETLAGESVYNPETGYEEYHVDGAAALQTVLDVYFEKE